MSRTGNKLIQILDNVDVNITDDLIITKGPKGEISSPRFNELNYEIDDNKLTITRKNDSRSARQKHGLSRTLIANNIEGITNGYVKNMHLQGIGYRVQQKGSNLEFSLGYSHPIIFEAPENISFKVEGQVKFSVQGISKEVVGQVCADIKKLRKTDFYKGKGIFFEGETIIKKQGKSIKK